MTSCSTSLRRNDPGRRGFTLLELVVVMAILAIVSTIAVRMTTDLGEEARWMSSQTQISNVQLAILGQANEFGSDGVRITSGFIADMGRLPKTTIESIAEYGGDTAHTLRELYVMPTNAALYRLYQASSANINTSAAFADTGVYVGCGWRGPYLRLSPGETLVRDGWGEPVISTVFSASTHQKNSILDSSGNGSTYTVPFDVMQVVAWGANRAAGSSDTGFDMDIPFSYTTNEVFCSFTAEVNLMGLVNTNASSVSNYTAQIVIYGPNPGTTGSSPGTKPVGVSAYQATVLVPAATTNNFTVTISSGLINPYNANAVTAYTLGPKKVTAYLYRGASAGATFASAVKKSALRTYVFRPGDNYMSIAVDR